MAEDFWQGGGKKVAGQTPRAWLIEAGLAGVAFFGWRILRRRRAAASSSSTSALGGSTVPGISFPTPGPAKTTTPAPIKSITDWLDSFLKTATTTAYNTGSAYNDFEAWQSGKCVSAVGFTALSQALATLGLPPNAVQYPLSVCKTAGTTGSNKKTGGTTAGTKQTPPPTTRGTPGGGPLTGSVPALSTALSKLLLPGERVVSSAFDKATNTDLYLTNLGGVYTTKPTGTATSHGFFGSYLGLPAGGRQGVRSFTDILANPDGSYTLIANDGSRYLFGPNPGAGETNLVGA